MLSAHGCSEGVGLHEKKKCEECEDKEEECEDKETERGTQGTHHLGHGQKLCCVL